MVNVTKCPLALLLYDFIYMAESLHPQQVVKNTISCPNADHEVIPQGTVSINFIFCTCIVTHQLYVRAYVRITYEKTKGKFS